MKRCKITAIRKTEYKDLMEKYENPMENACDIEEGQVFIAEGWKRPEGWMKNKKSAMISCNDGFRPVSFYIEVLEDERS